MARFLVPDDRRDKIIKRPTPLSVQAQIAGPIIEIHDEDTGRCDADELRRRRRARPTDQRIEHIENRLDDVVLEQGAMRGEIGALDGKLDGLDSKLDGVREGINGKLDGIHTVVEQALANGHVRLKAEVDIDRHQRVDEIDATKERRKRITKVIGAVTGAGTLGAIVHWIIGMI